ncbi:MAG: EAL domain-containing protein, partial [Sulfuricella sp.]|nr:EAL domain-containing protein [Sulfuricella sp.]
PHFKIRKFFQLGNQFIESSSNFRINFRFIQTVVDILNINNLKRFPITTVKIDQSFVQGIPHDAEDVAIVTTVIGMAKSLKLKVIAEGVENEEQLALLCELGCDEIQGYFFSRPLPAEGFAKWLRRGDVMDKIVAACKGNKVMRP